MRVTQGMIFDSANQSVATTLSALQKATEKVSSQKRLNRPSDDPADVRSSIQMHDTLSELNQFLRNIDVATSKVDAQDTALGSAGELLQRANELARRSTTSTSSRASASTDRPTPSPGRARRAHIRATTASPWLGSGRPARSRSASPETPSSSRP